MNGEITLNEIVEKYGIDISIKDVVASEFQESSKVKSYGSLSRQEVDESDAMSKLTSSNLVQVEFMLLNGECAVYTLNPRIIAPMIMCFEIQYSRTTCKRVLYRNIFISNIKKFYEFYKNGFPISDKKTMPVRKVYVTTAEKITIPVTIPTRE